MALSEAQVARLVLDEGATHDQAVKYTGIAWRESAGHPEAHNTNAGTGDNSYGLFQINMLGGLGPARRAQLGLSSNDQLLDPATNVHAARQLSGGWQNLAPWTVPGGSWNTNVNLAAANEAVTLAEGGNVTSPQTGQTPVQGVGANPAGGQYELRLSPDLPGTDWHAGVSFDKASVTKVALTVFGALVVLVGLWVTFTDTATGEKLKGAAVKQGEHATEEAAAA